MANSDKEISYPKQATNLESKHIRGRAFACEQAVGFVAVPVVAFLSYALVPNKPFGFDGWRWVVLIGAHCLRARAGWRKKGGSRKRTR